MPKTAINPIHTQPKFHLIASNRSNAIRQMNGNRNPKTSLTPTYLPHRPVPTPKLRRINRPKPTRPLTFPPTRSSNRTMFLNNLHNIVFGRWRRSTRPPLLHHHRLPPAPAPPAWTSMCTCYFNCLTSTPTPRMPWAPRSSAYDFFFDKGIAAAIPGEIECIPTESGAGVEQP